MGTIITGSHGSFEVSSNGYPVNHFMIPFHYLDVIQVDLDEWANHYGRDPDGETLDILDVGYWHPNGYEEPVRDE